MFLKSTATPILLILTLLLTACSTKPTNIPKTKHFIDTHIHIYDPTLPPGVTWPPKSDKILYKPHLPAEFKSVTRESGLTGVVIVEASSRLETNAWLLNLTKNDNFFIAVVGNIDPYRPDFEQQLLKLKADKRFVGLRARNPKPIDYTNPTVLKNLRTLARHNMSLDFLANGQNLKGIQNADALARAIPNLKIVYDHVLGYNIDGNPPPQTWIDAVNKLAQNKNVYCKVSGLYQRSTTKPAPTDIKYYKSVLDILYNKFTYKRLIYGSNWPVTKRSNNYTSFVNLVNQYFSKKGRSAAEHYYWKNAAHVYNLPLK